jgi:hypothetical protein
VKCCEACCTIVVGAELLEAIVRWHWVSDAEAGDMRLVGEAISRELLNASHDDFKI